jgi:acetyl esterase/lipase
MKKLLFAVICIALLEINGFSQKILHLYEGKAPSSEGWNYNEIEMPGRMIRNVVDQTLEVFMPDKSLATSTAVIVCPGGGNIWLIYSNEGTGVAKWLAGKGITAFVLKYRLLKTPEDPK